MATITVIFIAVFGLVIGSFLNVVIYRLPLGKSLVRPASSCPGCGARIKPYDNIPVLSYLLLGGKCRACGRKISALYPSVETLTAIAFVLVYLRTGRTLSPEWVAGCVFTSALIALGFIDYFDGFIYHAITIPCIVLALIYSFFRDDLTFRGALIGAFAGAGFLLFIYGIHFLIRRKEGLGMGDVIMLFMVGAYLGFGRTFLALLLATVIGSLVGVYLILRRGRSLQSALPFGVFFAPAAFIALLWGDSIIRSYSNYVRSILS